MAVLEELLDPFIISKQEGGDPFPAVCSRAVFCVEPHCGKGSLPIDPTFSITSGIHLTRGNLCGVVFYGTSCQLLGLVQAPSLQGVLVVLRRWPACALGYQLNSRTLPSRGRGTGEGWTLSTSLHSVELWLVTCRGEPYFCFLSSVILGFFHFASLAFWHFCHLWFAGVLGW